MHLATLPRRPLRSLIVSLAATLVALLATAPAHAGVGDLYITSDAINKVKIFSGTVGTLVGPYVNSAAASGEMAIHFGATNGRALLGHSGGGVEEFDASTGAYIKTYNAAGGWQWAGIYAPDGNVFIGDMNTNDVRKYDSTTGAFMNVLCPILTPSDMEFGPNGDLYVCSLNGFVLEVNPSNGNIMNIINLPPGAQANDIAFLPSGEMLITAMQTCLVYRFSPAIVPLGSFAGTGWLRPHGIAISPYTGNVMVVDGVTCQVHEFDPVTFTELNANWLNPWPALKIVDLAFRPQAPTPAVHTTWGRVKNLYR
jgi:streptogramin lyase